MKRRKNSLQKEKKIARSALYCKYQAMNQLLLPADYLENLLKAFIKGLKKQF